MRSFPRLDLLHALARTLGEEHPAGSGACPLAGSSDHRERAEERAEDHRRRGDGDGQPLAAERRRDLVRDQRRERRGAPASHARPDR